MREKMIRRCLHTHKKLLKYENSFYDSLEHARVLSCAKPDPNASKYDVENEKWMTEKEQPTRGGSEVNVNNPKVKPNES